MASSQVSDSSRRESLESREIRRRRAGEYGRVRVLGRGAPGAVRDLRFGGGIGCGGVKWSGGVDVNNLLFLWRDTHGPTSQDAVATREIVGQ